MVMTPASAGIDEAAFVAQVRDELEDTPRFRGTETATGNGVNTVFQIPNAPVFDGHLYGSAFWNVTVNGQLCALVSRWEDLDSGGGAPGKVWVDYQNGLAVFGQPPGSGLAIAFTHSSCHWLNRRIVRALRDGMNAMFPTIYQWQSVLLTMAVNKWEYNLPRIFNDPRARILDVEVCVIPVSQNRYVPISQWRRTADNSLMVISSQSWTPGTPCRVQFTSPYEDLAELEAQISELPVLYAKGTLLQAKEGPRARSDQASVTQQEGANPMGAQTNAGSSFLKQFYQRLGELERPMPMAPTYSTWGR